jgi:FkbM family methyltransferase
MKFSTLSKLRSNLRNLRIVDARHVASERLHLKRLLEFLDVDCVFDVGANAGQYATMLRKVVGYKGQIISFEPIPYLCDALRTRSKDDPLWSVREVALSDSSGEATFNIMESDRFSSLSAPSHDEVTLFSWMNSVKKQVQVKTETLRNLYPELQAEFGFKSPFLKMDTQGFDVSVVSGAGESIRHFVGLQSELAIKRLYEQSTGYQEAIKCYEKAGFSLSALVPNNAGHFPMLVEIDCIMVRNDLMRH